MTEATSKSFIQQLFSNVFAGITNAALLTVGSMLLPVQTGSDMQQEFIKFVIGYVSFTLSQNMTSAGMSPSQITAPMNKAGGGYKTLGGIVSVGDMFIIGLVNGNVALNMWNYGEGFFSIQNMAVGWVAYTVTELAGYALYGVDKALYPAVAV